MSAPHRNTLLCAIPADVCLTLDDLEPRAALPRKALKQALGTLVARGLVARPERGGYQLTKAGAQATESGAAETGREPETASLRPARDTFRRRLWAAMRMAKGSFTVADIARLAVRQEAAAGGNARHYCRALVRAGYLRRLPGSARAIRYALIRNTGPLPPVVRRAAGLLRDPNTGEVLPCRA